MIMRLWDATPAPLAIGDEAADVPTIEFFPPDGTTTTTTTTATAASTRASASGACALICPGGGYGALAPHEGKAIGEFLASHGIAGAVLTYRIAPRYKHPAPLLDVTRAMRLLRHGAGDLRIDPHRVAVIGFSAGGHLASSLSTHFDAGDAGAADPIDREPSRPDASVLCYPVITMTSPFAHEGSRNNLLGKPADAALIEELSNERHVTARTPPTFVFHTVDDAVVPVENALLYADALRKAKVPFEAHLYEHGHHGVGLASDDPRLSTWPSLMVSWLRSHGW